ncbi:uncharacterized protein [Procambarus clarkii]|uniref:uncharacterized protein n=1 Tax=Procambarus clarkii TaxID=6728 RepID=UPI0037425C82
MVYTVTVKEICEVVNTSFHVVSTTEPEQLSMLQDQMTVNERLFNIEVRAEEVKQDLASLDGTKAVGSDNVSPSILKEAAQALSVSLAKIFKLTKEQLPSCCKKINMVKIFKKGDIKEALNYRPVSLTGNPSKEI